VVVAQHLYMWINKVCTAMTVHGEATPAYVEVHESSQYLSTPCVVMMALQQ
jgi:hypothetical protein